MSSSSENENVSPWHSKPDLRASSPKRRPLHQRSDSDTNQRVGPTIRIVNDPDTSTYTQTPFPSHPSQILPPRNAHRGYAFEDQGFKPARVSDTSSTTVVPSSELSHVTENLVPKPLQLRKPNRTSGSTYNSDAETITDGSPFTPASVTRVSQDTTPPASPTNLNDPNTEGLGILQEEEEISPVAFQPKSTIRKVLSSEAGPSQPLNSQVSKVSLASSGSSDTLILHYSGEEPSDTSTSNLPLPPGTAKRPKKPKFSNPRSKKRAASAQPAPKPILKKSTDSLAASEHSRPSQDRPRSSSEPVSVPHVAFAARAERASIVQYPSIRAPSASSSRASSRTLPKKLSRMSDRISRRPWNSHLSTISSESERTSPAVSSVSDLGPSTSRLTGPLPEEPESAVLPPASLPRRTPSNIRPHDWRDSDEHHDVVTELQSPPPLKQQRSGYFSRFSADNRPSSSRGSTDTRPSSSQSNLSFFVSNTIPAWARYYYRRGERCADLGVDGSIDADSRRDSAHSTDGPSSVHDPNFRPGVYRPRTRPRRRSEAQTDSLVISEVSQSSQNWVLEPSREPYSANWTPRLQRDRRSGARLSAWRAPSLDETFGALSWSQGNRQVLFFCLGFIIPPLWIFASFLPIYAPGSLHEKAPVADTRDLENATTNRAAQLEEIHYQKARWWRNLNRIMSVVGVALLATIIVLSVLASRT